MPILAYAYALGVHAFLLPLYTDFLRRSSSSLVTWAIIVLTTCHLYERYIYEYMCAAHALIYSTNSTSSSSMCACNGYEDQSCVISISVTYMLYTAVLIVYDCFSSMWSCHLGFPVDCMKTALFVTSSTIYNIVRHGCSNIASLSL